jgi:hypothetical protein
MKQRYKKFDCVKYYSIACCLIKIRFIFAETLIPMKEEDVCLPYLNFQVEDLDGEIWIDVTGYDGIYLVSNLGRVKSYQREINMGKKGIRVQPERIMKQTINLSNFNNLKQPSRELKVSFCVDSIKKYYSVSVLVGNAFIGETKINEVFSKKDKCWYNNNANNLEISSVSDSHKLAYEKGNCPRIKKTLLKNQENKFIYTRLLDGKNFTGKELLIEYKKEIRTNLRKAIKKGSNAYGSKWSRFTN